MLLWPDAESALFASALLDHAQRESLNGVNTTAPKKAEYGSDKVTDLLLAEEEYGNVIDVPTPKNKEKVLDIRMLVEYVVSGRKPHSLCDQTLALVAKFLGIDVPVITVKELAKFKGDWAVVHNDNHFRLAAKKRIDFTKPWSVYAEQLKKIFSKAKVELSYSDKKTSSVGKHKVGLELDPENATHVD